MFVKLIDKFFADEFGGKDWGNAQRWRVKVFAEWLDEHFSPTKRALDAANVCRVINHFYVDGVCSQCGSIEPPRQ